MKHKSIIFYLLLTMLIAWVPLRTQTPPAEKQAQEVWLNFFVHGIMSIKPHLTLENFLRFMRDDVEDTTYAKTVELMRQDQHFYKNQAMQGFGLIEIDPENIDRGNASSALARILNEVTNLSHGPHVKNHYYTYGWSGLMSPSVRYRDSIGLLRGIDEEVEKYKELGFQPKVRVIGYSHGGNVVLNLGAVRQNEPDVNKNLVIDETVLLGMPVQAETDYLIHDQIFKRVYHIFSACDRVQKLDFFSYNRLFSQRIFRERKGFELPNKLVQVQLKLTRSSQNLVKKSKKRFLKSYNFKNPTVVSGKSHLLRDSSPGHAELWFFGWTPLHYRKSFALAPLPTVAILPFILKTVQEVEAQLSPYNPVIIDMRPDHGITVVKNVKSKKFHKVVDFIPRDSFKKLQAMATPYAPDSFTIEQYDERIHQAYLDAHDFYKAEWSLGARRRKQKTTQKKYLPTEYPPIKTNLS